jgi:CheY-like chemotaxis protein
MDISMPEVSGIDLCKTLHTMPTQAGVRIIACTAHASPRDTQQFQQIGFDVVLTKPFLMNDLKLALAITA